MMRCFVLSVAAFVCATPLLAQSQDQDALRAELERCKRELQDRQSETDALVDARMRYDMGLGGESVPMPGGEITANAATAPSIERAQLQLSQEEAVTANLHNRLAKLQKEAERRRVDVASARRPAGNEPEWVVVPVAGSQPSHRDVPQAHAAPLGESSATTKRVEEVAAAAPEVRIAPNLQPIRAQIDGSDNHGLVATSLLKASQSLVDRADQLRAQGFDKAADEALDEAKQRLQLAVEELQRDEKNKDSFPHLFHLGRSRELLFRIAERREGLDAKTQPKEYQRREQEVRDAYVAITAKDAVRKDGQDELGPWGRAAQSAMDHFRWINLHGGYRPKTDPLSITWPGEKQ